LKNCIKISKQNLEVVLLLNHLKEDLDLTKNGSAVEHRILLAAKALFAQKGHEETTLREIAARARTSESQIIKYFQSKAGILDALFELARSHIDVPFKRLFEEIDDPSTLLEKLSSILLNFLEADPELLKVYLFSRHFYALLSDEQVKPGAQFRKRLGDIFMKGQEIKIFRDDFRPEVASSALWGGIQGMIRDKLYAQRTKDFYNISPKEMEAVLKIFIAALVRR
jgi:AcrR family transcriptional regulator